jgi:hypothetical protein
MDNTESFVKGTVSFDLLAARLCELAGEPRRPERYRSENGDNALETPHLLCRKSPRTKSPLPADLALFNGVGCVNLTFAFKRSIGLEDT